MSDLETMVRELADRVKLLEDRQELHRIINSYGPGMDTGEGKSLGALWAEDGVYDYGVTTDENRVAEGPAGLAAMTASAFQLEMNDEGCAHIMSMPVIWVNGDTARATGYSRVYRHSKDGFYVWRLSANHWEFVRTPDGWRVARRTNRLLDGNPVARELLVKAYDKA